VIVVDKIEILYYNKYIFNLWQGRTSRGVSGALHLQSAPAGMNSGSRVVGVQPGYVSGDERQVLRNVAP